MSQENYRTPSKADRRCSPLPTRTNGRQTREKRARSPSDEGTTSSAVKDVTTLFDQESLYPILPRHLPLTSGVRQSSFVPLQHASVSHTSIPQQVMQSRPISGPLLVESILEEEALLRKGESSLILVTMTHLFISRSRAPRRTSTRKHLQHELKSTL